MKEADGSGLHGWKTSRVSGREVTHLSFSSPGLCVCNLGYLRMGLWEAWTCVGLRSYCPPWTSSPLPPAWGSNLRWGARTNQWVLVFPLSCPGFLSPAFLAIAVVTSKSGCGTACSPLWLLCLAWLPAQEVAALSRGCVMYPQIARHMSTKLTFTGVKRNCSCADRKLIRRGSKHR